jgi:hypothetical protein
MEQCPGCGGPLQETTIVAAEAPADPLLPQGSEAPICDDCQKRFAVEGSGPDAAIRAIASVQEIQSRALYERALWKKQKAREWAEARPEVAELRCRLVTSYLPPDEIDRLVEAKVGELEGIWPKVDEFRKVLLLGFLAEKVPSRTLEEIDRLVEAKIRELLSMAVTRYNYAYESDEVRSLQERLEREGWPENEIKARVRRRVQENPGG